MPIPKTPQDIQVLNGMAQFYIWFVIFFTSIMALITKLFRKIKEFEWTIECQTTWEDIKSIHSNSYIHWS